METTAPKKRGAPRGRRTKQYQCFSCKVRYPDSQFYKRGNGCIVAECKECAKDRQAVSLLRKHAEEFGAEWLEAKIVRLNKLLDEAKQIHELLEPR